MSALTPELAWKFVGKPKRNIARDKWTVPVCEACADASLNVWQRVGTGTHGINLHRCWLHGPGQDGRECDGPEQAKG